MPASTMTVPDPQFNSTVSDRAKLPRAIKTALDAIKTDHESAKNSRRYVTWMKDSADGAAGDATSERPFFRAQDACTVTGIHIEPAAALTAHDTNNATITVARRNADGTSKATVATLTTNTASGDWVAFDDKSMGTLTNAALSSGQSLTVEITKANSGVIVPVSAVVVHFTVD